MESNNDIDISIIKGDKLFNNNNPFAINLLSLQTEGTEKKCNADLICVIDISGSMRGEKINQVKESLKILLTLMDEKDRICLILFSELAEKYYDLNYLTRENKDKLINLIDKIYAGGGTNILSGLQIAIDVLKKDLNNKKNEKSVSSILLLSDGCDNYSNDIQLANSLKNLTKGFGLSFTLNTFGYGDDHDASIMNKLANLRDGSFFYVENYSKISEYFVSILGGCVSVISKKLDIKVSLLNKDCRIAKVYGEDKLFSHESNEQFFKTTMLQFICGKEYTFVLEIFIDDSKVQIDEEFLNVEIIYEDISQDNKLIKNEKKYNYRLKDLEFSKANEEYIRVYIYHILDEALKLKDNRQYEKGKKMLEDIEKWVKNNYKGNNKYYIQDIQNAKGLFSKDQYEKLKSVMMVNSSIQENAFKKTGVTMNFCNMIQMNMIRSIQQNQIDVNNQNITGITQNINMLNRNIHKMRKNYDLIPNNFEKNINVKKLEKNKKEKGPIGPKFGKNISIDRINIDEKDKEDDF